MSFESELEKAFTNAGGTKNGYMPKRTIVFAGGRRIVVPKGAVIHFCNDASPMGSSKAKRQWNYATVFLDVKEIVEHLSTQDHVLSVRPWGEDGCRVFLRPKPGRRKVTPRYESSAGIRSNLVIR